MLDQIVFVLLSRESVKKRAHCLFLFFRGISEHRMNSLFQKYHAEQPLFLFFNFSFSLFLNLSIWLRCRPAEVPPNALLIQMIQPRRMFLMFLQVSSADKCCFFRGINNTPLHHFQMENTQDQYCTVIIKQLAMLMRPKKKYIIPLTADLQEALQLFKEFLQGGERDLAQDQLHNVFMALWKEKWKPTKDNAIPCPTIQAFALMTLHLDGHFAEPKYVTSLITKWERAIRLAFVKEIKALSETMEEEEACRILQPWFTEKSLCPFNSLRSLQHRASSISKTTMALPKIVWVDRINWTTLLYAGTKISLQQIIDINREMEKDLIEAWENNVLLGLKIRVNYDKIFFE
jgi:hypothetical protein